MEKTLKWKFLLLSGIILFFTGILIYDGLLKTPADKKAKAVREAVQFDTRVFSRLTYVYNPVTKQCLQVYEYNIHFGILPVDCTKKVVYRINKRFGGQYPWPTGFKPTDVE